MNMQIRVKGWKQYYSDTNYTILYNEEFVSASCHTGDASISTSWNGWHNILVDTWIRPSRPVIALDVTGNIETVFNDNNTQIQFRSITGANLTTKINCHAIWDRRS